MKPDVLVVDLGMPEMDGFEFIAAAARLAEPAVRDAARRRADRVRALGRSDQGAAKRLRDASRQAGRSRRACGLGRDAGEADSTPLTHRPRRSGNVYSAISIARALSSSLRCALVTVG